MVITVTVVFSMIVVRIGITIEGEGILVLAVNAVALAVDAALDLAPLEEKEEAKEEKGLLLPLLLLTLLLQLLPLAVVSVSPT